MNGKISNYKQIASIRRYTVTEGREKGLDVIDCDNGRIRFLLNVTKALDVMQLWHEGQNMSFVSKNAFTPRETDFLNRFEGGMIYTCGLDNMGRRDGFELHGSHHNQTAQIVRAECTEEGITVEAVIYETALFGQNLVFRRKVFTAIGSGSVSIEDTLENAGYTDAEYGILYHINLGYPMLDEGTRIVADCEDISARTEFATANIKDAFLMTDSVAGQDEMCYYLTLRKPEISLVNDKIGKKFTVSYSKETLPYFLEWKSMASGDYALGLEPTTTILDNEFKYRTVAPGEKKTFNITLSVE